MSVITFASSKGGAGKTTSAIVLAVTLAQTHDVVVIDCDPAERLMKWGQKGKLPGHLTLKKSRGEKFIHDEIAEAAGKVQYVILDLEGAATRLNAFAMGESDLVIIPMGDETPDAEAAIDTLTELSLQGRALRREIPARILFARTKAAVKSRLERSLNAQIRDKIGSFTTEMHTRSAFSALHAYGGTLYSLPMDEVTGVTKAMANAQLFADEVKEVLGATRRIGNVNAQPLFDGSKREETRYEH